MTFEEALTAMRNGKKVKRKNSLLMFCIDKSYFSAINDKTVCYIDCDSGIKIPAKFEGRDLLEDWEIVDD